MGPLLAPPDTHTSMSPRSMGKRIIPISPHSPLLFLTIPRPAPLSLSWQLPRGMNPIFLPQPQLAPKEAEAEESSPTTPRSPAPVPPPLLLGYPQGAAGQGWAVSPFLPKES